MSTQINTVPVRPRNKKKIYSVENLRRYTDLDEALLTPALRGSRTRQQQGVSGYYGYLPTVFPLHYRAFRNMHDVELSEGYLVSVDFEMTTDGLINFILAVGPVPSNLKNPLLARLDPEDGFFAENLKWENSVRFRPICARRALEIANHYK